MKKALILALAVVVLTTLSSCMLLMPPAPAPQEPVYNIGDRGPAGGIVIYDKGFRADGWRYIEAAPEDLNPAPSYGYARTGNWDKNELAGTDSSVGYGKMNTYALVKKMGDEPYRTNSGNLTVKSYAALEAKNYVLNGYADWFIPSLTELQAMARNKNVLPGIDTSRYYWSSTEHQNGTSAYYVDMKTGDSSYAARENNMNVRVVRYF